MLRPRRAHRRRAPGAVVAGRPGRAFAAARAPLPHPRTFLPALVTATTMDTSTLLFAILTATLIGVTFHARRLGNEKRDVVLLGAFSGLCGMGTAVAAIL